MELVLTSYFQPVFYRHNFSILYLKKKGQKKDYLLRLEHFFSYLKEQFQDDGTESPETQNVQATKEPRGHRISSPRDMPHASQFAEEEPRAQPKCSGVVCSLTEIRIMHLSSQQLKTHFWPLLYVIRTENWHIHTPRFHFLFYTFGKLLNILITSVSLSIK